jgi:hypothetical protein
MEPTIRTITVAEAFDSPVFAALCDEYRAEALRNPDMMGALPDRDGYARMVDAGLLHPLGVFVGDELVGLCAVLIAPVLHFGGKVIASTETIFVALFPAHAGMDRPWPIPCRARWVVPRARGDEPIPMARAFWVFNCFPRTRG